MSELMVIRPGIVSLHFGVTAARALKALVGDASECPSS
jgi:hypothetical protein